MGGGQARDTKGPKDPVETENNQRQHEPIKAQTRETPQTPENMKTTENTWRHQHRTWEDFRNNTGHQTKQTLTLIGQPCWNTLQTLLNPFVKTVHTIKAEMKEDITRHLRTCKRCNCVCSPLLIFYPGRVAYKTCVCCNMLYLYGTLGGGKIHVCGPRLSDRMCCIIYLFSCDPRWLLRGKI